MLWVCRAGQGGTQYDFFLQTQTIRLVWDGYIFDLNCCSSRDDFRNLVIKEKNPSARTSISNWAGQLFSFKAEMQIGDYVLIPSAHSRFYTLCKIDSSYQFSPDEQYPHFRSVKIIKKNISRDSFPQSIRYSLGAYRTVFKIRQEREVLAIIDSLQ